MRYSLTALTILFLITSNLLRSQIDKSDTREITLSAGIRHQLERRHFIKQVNFHRISENFSSHLVPYLELEYHKKGFVAQISLGYFRGGDTLTHSSSTGHIDHHFLPYYPSHNFTRDNWKNIQHYSYLTYRAAISGRFFRKRNFNLDLGVFFNFDILLSAKSSDHVHSHTTGVSASNGPNNYFSPGSSNTSINHEPFEIINFKKTFVYSGIRIAPRIKINKHFNFGLEFNLKFQLEERLSYKMQNQFQKSKNYNLLAFDYLLKLGYTF